MICEVAAIKSGLAAFVVAVLSVPGLANVGLHKGVGFLQEV